MSKEEKRKYALGYYYKHRDKILKKRKEFRKLYPERQRAYREKYNNANREKVNAYHRKHYAIHKEEINKKRAILQNTTRICKCCKKTFTPHHSRQKYCNLCHKREVKRKVGFLKLRFQVFARDNFTCQYCGRKVPEVILEVDHKYPKSKGGENKIGNYITACRECNRGKGDMILKLLV